MSIHTADVIIIGAGCHPERAALFEFGLRRQFGLQIEPEPLGVAGQRKFGLRIIHENDMAHPGSRGASSDARCLDDRHPGSSGQRAPGRSQAKGCGRCPEKIRLFTRRGALRPKRWIRAAAWVSAKAVFAARPPSFCLAGDLTPSGRRSFRSNSATSLSPSQFHPAAVASNRSSPSGISAASRLCATLAKLLTIRVRIPRKIFCRYSCWVTDGQKPFL